jgi:uncharacterized protein YhhL (DUF1145 family)
METIKIALIIIVFIWLVVSYILGIIHIFDKDLNTFEEVIWAFIIFLLSPIFIIELIACSKENIEDSDIFIGCLFNINSCWIGYHYSTFNKRLCINLIPFFTIYIVFKGGNLPIKN